MEGILEVLEFLKVSLLLNLLCEMNVELTFENFRGGGGKGGGDRNRKMEGKPCSVGLLVRRDGRGYLKV